MSNVLRSFTDDEIHREVARRVAARASRVCDYCMDSADSDCCDHRDRHLAARDCTGISSVAVNDSFSALWFAYYPIAKARWEAVFAKHGHATRADMVATQEFRYHLMNCAGNAMSLPCSPLPSTDYLSDQLDKERQADDESK